MSGKRKLRSQEWFGGNTKNAFMHRSWMKLEGMPEDSFNGRPVIGICNTWCELTPCNAHLRDLSKRVKRGVYEAGGLPLEFQVMSLGESNMRPTAMLFRNLASMDVEESIRANMGLPPKLLAQGVTDMVRISDATMSGTAYGTVVLHVAPEAAAGGTLAPVQDGDIIELDVEKRHLDLKVGDDELERRRVAWKAPSLAQSGYESLFVKSVLQADEGLDFDFLVGCRGAAVPRNSH